VLQLKGGPGIPNVKQKVKGAAVAHFLPGGSFSIEDVTGTAFGGSWSGLPGDVDVTITTEDVLDFLGDGLGSKLPGLEDLTISSLTSTAKITQKKNGVGALLYKFGFVMEFSVKGIPVRLTYKLVVKGLNDLDSAARGATWALNGKQTYKAKGVKLNSVDPLQLVVGPDGGLAADRFALRDGGGTDLFGGYYTRVQNRLFLQPDGPALEDYVEAWIAPTVQQMFPGGIVTLDVGGSKFKAVIKKNGTVRLTGKTKFFSELSGPSDSGDFKSAFGLNVSG